MLLPEGQHGSPFQRRTGYRSKDSSSAGVYSVSLLRFFAASVFFLGGVFKFLVLLPKGQHAPPCLDEWAEL
jgi:hypothetical protein